MKITLEKSIFMFFLPNFDTLKKKKKKIFFFFFFYTDPNFQRILHLLSLTPSIPTFSKIWALIKSGRFNITHFNLHSSWGRKAHKAFVFALSFQLSYIFNSIFFLLKSFNDLCKVPLMSPKWTFPHSITLLFSIFQQFPSPMFQHILWLKRKNSLSDFRGLKLILV